MVYEEDAQGWYDQGWTDSPGKEPSETVEDEPTDDKSEPGYDFKTMEVGDLKKYCDENRPDIKYQKNAKKATMLKLLGV